MKLVLQLTSGINFTYKCKMKQNESITQCRMLMFLLQPVAVCHKASLVRGKAGDPDG